MPAPDVIVAGLTAAASDWRWLAVAWHAVLGLSLAFLVAGWRPPIHLVRVFVVASLLSVSVTSWLSGNPFNGLMFGVLGAVLGGASVALPAVPATGTSFAAAAPGAALISFGATYPHFVRVESWLEYAYASPFGILPCPTLSIAIGVTLLCSNLRTTAWSAPLALAGLLYGAIGAFRLDVTLDVGLLLGSAVLAVTAVFDGRRRQSDHAASRSGETSCPPSHRAA